MHALSNDQRIVDTRKEVTGRETGSRAIVWKELNRRQFAKDKSYSALPTKLMRPF